MSDQDQREWTLRWFEKGDHDLQAAEAIFHSEDAPYDMVCFHAQQCVEKYLKGFLTFHEQEVRRTHDLVSLVVECSRIDPSFAEWEEVCEQLTGYAVETRYPDDLFEYSAEDAEEAISSARRFSAFIRNKVDLD